MSGPLALVVRDDDPLPPYEQLRRQLERLIREGALAPGSRLPALRQLAGDLGVAVGTLGRVYRELEEAGLVESRRAAGTRVSSSLPVVPADQRLDHLDRCAAEFVRAARAVGAAILGALRRALDPTPG
jgi:GntR family transcriptional regulator